MARTVNSCCCGLLDLKTGALIISYIALVLNFLGSLTFGVTEIFGRYQEKHVDGSDAIFVLSILIVILSAEAIYGIHNNRSSMLYPLLAWIALMFIYAIIVLISTIVWGVKDSRTEFWPAAISSIIFIIIDGYFFVILESHFVKMDDPVREMP